jgi:hypothetical protein
MGSRSRWRSLPERESVLITNSFKNLEKLDQLPGAHEAEAGHVVVANRATLFDVEEAIGFAVCDESPDGVLVIEAGVGVGEKLGDAGGFGN